MTTSVDRIADAVDGAASGSASAEIRAFATALPERLVGYLLAHYLERQHPVVAGVGELLGLLERNAAAATAAAPAYVERKLRLDLLGDLLDDPVAVLANDYNWGAVDLEWDKLLDRLARFANSVAKVAFVQPGPGGGPPVLRIFMVDLGPTPGPFPPPSPPPSPEFVPLPGSTSRRSWTCRSHSVRDSHWTWGWPAT